MTQIKFWFSSEIPYEWEQEILRDCIIDRGSHYTVSVFSVSSREQWKEAIQILKRDSYFAKATHNSYAWRIQSENWIIEGKNDDGEVGAGMCILRELQRAERVNICVVVTRYFWWIQLQSDRFKHVIDATKMILEKIKAL